MTLKTQKSKLSQPSATMYKDEGTLLRKAIEWLEPQRRDGIKVLKIRDRYAKGYSDLFLCVRGQFVVLELKDDVGKPTPHQVDFIQEMKLCGAIGGVCRSVAEIAHYVEEAKKVRTEWM